MVSVFWLNWLKYTISGTELGGFSHGKNLTTFANPVTWNLPRKRKTLRERHDASPILIHIGF
jgi:hypothetical protein